MDNFMSKFMKQMTWATFLTSLSWDLSMYNWQKLQNFIDPHKDLW